MEIVSIPAHFDGEHILLDEPIQLEPHVKLLVTVLPFSDDEREGWLRLSTGRLESAYGEEEEAYSLDLIKEKNPDYEAR